MKTIPIVILLALPWSTTSQSTCSSIYLDTQLGEIEGCKISSNYGEYNQFSKIPYAQPPIGERRFRPSELVSEWPGGYLDAKQSPPMCPQRAIENDSLLGQEDCLYLNVFTPSSGGIDKKGSLGPDVDCYHNERAEGCSVKKEKMPTDTKELLPVMVFIHGGGFTRGDADPTLLNPNMLVQRDVIVVTFTYRLGALGFFTLLSPTTPGNLGIRDMLLALDWVQANIADYGGDPGSVTLFGNSAGSMAISLLLTIPEAPFHRAILQSGTLVSPIASHMLKYNKTEDGIAFAKDLGCSDVDTLVECMQDKPHEDIVAVSYDYGPYYWYPTVDAILGDASIMPTDQLTAFQSGRYKRVPVIIGSNTADGLVELEDMFVRPDEFYRDLQTDYSKHGSKLLLGDTNVGSKDVGIIENLRYFYMGESRIDKSVESNLVELVSDNVFQAGGRTILEIIMEKDPGLNIYQYLFAYVGTFTNSQLWFGTDRRDLGACHADDLLYLFTSKLLDPLVTDTDILISERMISFWTNFSKFGNPNGNPESLDVEWSPLTQNDPSYLIVDKELEMSLSEGYKAKTDFWDHVLKPTFSMGTKLGTITGLYKTTTAGKCFLSFQSIPYAEPPLGNLRFVDPVKSGPWKEPLDATQQAPKCLQGPAIYDSKEEASEDCLYLNVYVPCNAQEALPVVVAIHGGALSRGSGGNYIHGPEFLMDKDVVLVTMNYRLAPFSFLSLESAYLPGNQGFKDQRLALEWVQDNIEDFNGDPKRVMLYGESAGGHSVLLHVSTMLSEGLFQSAAIHSASSLDLSPFNEYQPGKLRKSALSLAAELQCPMDSDQDILECLQERPALDILEKSSAAPDAFYSYFFDFDYSVRPFFLNVPSVALSSGSFYRVPTILGFNSEEGVLKAAEYILHEEKFQELVENWDTQGLQLIFGKCCQFSDHEKDIGQKVWDYYFANAPAVDGLIKLFTDQHFVVGNFRAANYLAEFSPVYLYNINYRGTCTFVNLLGINSTSYGTCHADDLFYLFNPRIFEFPCIASENDGVVRDTMVQMLTDFAVDHKPTGMNGAITFNWEQFVKSDPKYLSLNENPGMAFSADFSQRIAFWERIAPLAPTVIMGGSTITGVWEESNSGTMYKAFKGIKYAWMVKRFSDARPIKSYPSTVMAVNEGPRCPQGQGSSDEKLMSEECLYLNIYAPKSAVNLPVMVWIHGGAYIRGHGGQELYGPQFFMEAEDVVLVTVNYRLGAFGFLSLNNELAPGNMALRDQNLALKWVHNNIAAFGADPERVTVFGESAGSFSVMHQIVSHQSAGLFQRAIAQSGAPFGTYFGVESGDKSRLVAQALAKSLNCEVETDAGILECLRSRSMNEILTKQMTLLCDEGPSGGPCIADPWNVVIDKEFHADPFLPDYPENLMKKGEHNKVPTLLGVNTEEGIYSAARFLKDPTQYDLINMFWEPFYGPHAVFDTWQPSDKEKELANRIKTFYLGDDLASFDSIHAVIDMFSDIIFWAGSHRYTLLALNHSETIYSYLLSYKPSQGYSELILNLDSREFGLGVCHADDLFLLYKVHAFDLSYSSDDLAVRQNMIEMWKNFAKGGQPHEDWRPFSASEPGYYNIDVDSKMEYSERYKERMDFWMEILDEWQNGN